MRLSVLPAVLVLAVLSAGCLAPTLSGVPVATGPESPAETVTTTDGSTPSASANATNRSSTGAATTAAPTPTPAPPKESPWGPDPIVVAVENDGNPDRDYAPQVRRAARYWEANAGYYAGFAVNYTVRPDAENPDLVVRFVDDVPTCGDAMHAAGCAPVIRRSGQVDRPETVHVRTGLSDSSTAHVVTHELGHTLGLGHDDAPNGVMRARSILYTNPRLNATDRAYPWADSDFSVYVDAENASDPEGVREQVRHSLSYFERGAGGAAPDNLSFSFVDSPAEADVVVGFSDVSPCGQGSGSCFTTLGPDPDGDGAIETYTKLRVVLVDLDTDATGWHVGNWFAYGLGMERADERPSPFRNAGYRERRSEWWS